MAGSIQGLGNKPKHADILLVTVTEVETIAIRKLFSTIQKHYIGEKTYYELGEVGGANVFLVQSEMGAGGQGGTIRTIEKGIDTLSPIAVIMVGIAFGIKPEKQKIGDILVSQQILDYELQRISTGPNGEFVINSRGDKVSASPKLLNRFRDGAIEWKEAGEPARVQFGLILSGAKLIDSQDFREQLRAFGAEAIGGEMEGAGLSAAAQGNKVDWILVKAICDWADGKKDDNKQAHQELAAANAARFVINVIKQGGMRSESPQVAQLIYANDAQFQSEQQRVQAVMQPNSLEAIAMLQHKIDTENFDVFLCYNSIDRADVKKIGMALKAHGILPWFDEWELIPGQPWQRALEQQIRKIKSAAVFVGPMGMGPWHRSEMDAFLRQVKKRDCPVIPVLLSGVSEEPNLPVFLEEMSWIDFRKKDPNPLEQLIWGITGKRGSIS